MKLEKQFKQKWKTVFFAVLGTLILAGCNGSGDGGSNGGGKPDDPDAVILSGRVLNNYTDVNTGAGGIGGARVILVNAADVQTANSVSPVEDTATAGSAALSATTDPQGNYRFVKADFSDADPASGRYFIFVDPPDASFLPGGSASRQSIDMSGAAPVEQNIILSDAAGDGADYIGSSLCLLCHPEKNQLKRTLHFAGIRKIGIDGTEQNGLMEIVDGPVYEMAENNTEMLSRFTNPPTEYAFADIPGESFWLGRDAGGLFFQLTATANPKFYVKYTYGGETGLWRGLFMTTVYAADGTYAAEHGPDGDNYAYFVFAPFQYNEDSKSLYGEAFVSYRSEMWDFSGAGGFTGDPAMESFDLNCAACHGATGINTANTGRPSEVKTAVYTQDPNGYDLDGVTSQINMGCEKCHGPGSNHLAAGGEGRRIVAPDKLSPGRLAMICGACHIRGENHTDFGGEAPVKPTGNAAYTVFAPGTHPGIFFGTPDGTGKNVIPFGTEAVSALTPAGYLRPVDFQTDFEASWMDVPYGAVVNHSRKFRQHYPDLVRTAKFANRREILTCISCHNAHGSGYAHMVIHKTENNAACLGCHSGPGRLFAEIPRETAVRLENDTTTPADLSVIGEAVEQHMFNKTGTLQMGPYDPEKTKMGRCSLCHMPRTAKSADWQNALETIFGQYRRGDITAHTFDVMATEAVNEMGAAVGAADATPAGITHECGTCHRFAGLN